MLHIANSSYLEILKMKKKKKKIWIPILTAMAILVLAGVGYKHITRDRSYHEIECSTAKVGEGTNEVQGIILHHTATTDVRETLKTLCFKIEHDASCHVVISKDGTRYILAPPTAVTWHAGYSLLNGRENCNDFTIGIEFMGNTQESPLTKAQINSAIEYILPIMRQYGIPKENIVTHEKVRHDWMVKNPDRTKELGVKGKVDISAKEYIRFMAKLEKKMEEYVI